MAMSLKLGADERVSTSRSFPWLYAGLILLVLLKATWGLWHRDLTYGDTSNYFQLAMRWFQSGQVNIVWSPLYTAYFGSWLFVTQDGASAVLLHRLFLIVISTIFVAWFALRSLPPLLAFALTCWWVVLPIHYDTLYEVHLFGALPMMVLSVIAVAMSSKWRMSVMLAVSIGATVLVRNEYVIAVTTFSAWILFSWFRNRASVHQVGKPQQASIRHIAICVLPVLLLIGFFYSVSVVKGSAIREASEPKHTLNMCQVYAFGYQQRHSNWTKSPWTDCRELMTEKFGQPLPSISTMAATNPLETLQHFLWNLSLTRAGAEVLLFNVTAADDNPDYVPVQKMKVIPTVLVIVTTLLLLFGAYSLLKKSSSSALQEQKAMAIRLLPLLAAATLMAIAVIVTQRPRPSYLLGFGVLYVWGVCVGILSLVPSIQRATNKWFMLVVALVIVVLVPSYQSLAHPPAIGPLHAMYEQLNPHSKSLCTGRGDFALNDYQTDLVSYICAPYPAGVGAGLKPSISISSLSKGQFQGAGTFVAALEAKGVTAAVIDMYLLQKYPTLVSCAELSKAFTASGWQTLTFTALSNPSCIAAFVKPTT